MKIIQVEYPFHGDAWMPSSLAIGYFDGVHRGHREVIRRAQQRARELHLMSGVITFHPHPREVLQKESITTYITPLPDKLEVFRKMGIDVVYVIKFTKEFSSLIPQDFVQQILFKLDVRHIVVGFDFCFGKGGLGTPKDLDFLSEGRYQVETVEAIVHEGKKVSSSYIRSQINEGNMDEVTYFLTRPYHLRGKVIPGERRGRTIGFPTANIQLAESYILPKKGVYGVRVRTDHGSYLGVMNIGVKPTFHPDRTIPSMEIHILDFTGDLYQTELIIEVLFFIREEKRFHGVQALIEQIKADILFAKDKFLCYTDKVK